MQWPLTLSCEDSVATERMGSGAAHCPLNFPTISNAFHLDNYETHNLVPRLSPPQRPLCVAGRLGRKKKKTRVPDSPRACEEPLPIVPRVLSIYDLINARGVYLILGVQDGAFLDRRA